MDRALLATYRKGFSFWGKLGQFSLRFGIALLIAVTVAHPVVLLLFSERIDAAYNEGRIKTERDNLSQQCDLKNPQSELRLLDEKMALLRSELKNSTQLFEPPICNNNTSPSNMAETSAIEKLTQELAVLKAKQSTSRPRHHTYLLQTLRKKNKGRLAVALPGLEAVKKGRSAKNG